MGTKIYSGILKDMVSQLEENSIKYKVYDFKDGWYKLELPTLDGNKLMIWMTDSVKQVGVEKSNVGLLSYMTCYENTSMDISGNEVVLTTQSDEGCCPDKQFLSVQVRRKTNESK